MIRQIGFVFAALILSSCATALEEPVQDLHIDIVGTGEALCDVTQPGRRYRAYAPGSIRVMKSDDPLKVVCAAPGNRELSVTLTPKMTPMLAANITNGVIPGVTWDYLSGAAHHYPDKVVMDFSAMPPQHYPMPDYQYVIEQNPHIAGMEMFRPGKAALISDIGQQTPTLMPREAKPSAMEVMTDSPGVETLEVTTTKSAPVADSDMMNPDIYDSEDK
ncbi:MAG: hypothetical protein ACXW30_00645 [Micavibrio sp.]